MSTPTDIIRLPSHSPRRAALRGIRLGDFPVIPIAILGVIALVAVFANLLAPHNPEVGSLRPASIRRSGSTAAAPNTCSAPTNSAATCCRG